MNFLITNLVMTPSPSYSKWSIIHHMLGHGGHDLHSSLRHDGVKSPATHLAVKVGTCKHSAIKSMSFHEEDSLDIEWVKIIPNEDRLQVFIEFHRPSQTCHCHVPVNREANYGSVTNPTCRWNVPDVMSVSHVVAHTTCDQGLYPFTWA
jgi:hypothetical protein